MRVPDVAWFNLQRPWNQFFERFSVPKQDWAAFERRVYANLWYWRSNYIVVGIVVSLWTLLSNPATIFCASLCIPLWAYCAFLRKDFKFGSARLTRQQVIVGLCIFSLILFLWTGAFLPSIFIGSCSAALTLLHATFRPANTKATVSRGMADMRMRMGLGVAKDDEIDSIASMARSAFGGETPIVDPEAAGMRSPVPAQSPGGVQDIDFGGGAGGNHHMYGSGWAAGPAAGVPAGQDGMGMDGLRGRPAVMGGGNSAHSGPPGHVPAPRNMGYGQMQAAGPGGSSTVVDSATLPRPGKGNKGRRD